MKSYSVVAAALAVAALIHGTAAFALGSDQTPGQKIQIDPKTLPKPGASPSRGNPPHRIPLPADATLKVPTGFVVNVFADHIGDARNVRVAANGDVFVVASSENKIFFMHDEDGKAVGGLWGRLAYDWLFIELLAVPEQYRGQDHGTALMNEAERIARASGCTGIWLDTYEFQARGFYEKLGFEVFGTLEDHPAGQRRFFLRKHL